MIVMIYLAHQTGETETSAQSLSHKISDNPLIAILLISAFILIVLACIVLIFSNKADSPKSSKSDRADDDEKSQG